MFELLFFAAAGAALLAVAIYADLQRKPRSKSRDANAPSFARQRQGVFPAQEARLVRLLRGDRRAAYRLVNSIQIRNPDRSERWCWEKAIYDVERDRT